MRLNSSTQIIGEKVILVPYRRQHVLKYHNWMKSIELQTLTGSEPLTLEEEYKMQESWLNDDDKCTFIILDKECFQRSNDEIASMVGDTNIFINNDEHRGEIEIMIAEGEFRGKGLGWESVVLMLMYGLSYINIKVFEAKISTDNTSSISLFKKLKFNEISNSKIFNEITFEKQADPEWVQFLSKNCKFEINELK